MDEEQRRRCIIDPSQCIPPPGALTTFTPQQQALGEELYLAWKTPHDQPWAHLSPDHQEPWLRQATALLAVWEFGLAGSHEKLVAALKAEHEEQLAAALAGTEK